MKLLTTLLLITLAMAFVRSKGVDCGQKCTQNSDCCLPDQMFCCPHWHLCMDRSTGSTVGPACGHCNADFLSSLKYRLEAILTEEIKCPDHETSEIPEKPKQHEIPEEDVPELELFQLTLGENNVEVEGGDAI